MTLWDNRNANPTHGKRMECYMGANYPGSILAPKGVAHCYRCLSIEPGWVFNAPNRLYAGERKKAPIDEIRYEDDPENLFVKDELTRRIYN